MMQINARTRTANCRDPGFLIPGGGVGIHGIRVARPQRINGLILDHAGASLSTGKKRGTKATGVGARSDWNLFIRIYCRSG